MIWSFHFEHDDPERNMTVGEETNKTQPGVSNQSSLSLSLSLIKGKEIDPKLSRIESDTKFVPSESQKTFLFFSTMQGTPKQREEAEEERGGVLMEKSGAAQDVVAKQIVEAEPHPYAFHVSGPRNLCSPTWRDNISSSWKDGNYKRTVIACFIQAIYLLELDRQENRNADNALAPKWWIPFKYKLIQTLIDERDGSIFGAILEWDRSAALADFVVMRPSGAPRAVLALRGTLLKGPTMRRDIEDDLRFLAWESLKGSVRFKVALEALKSVAEKYGSSNVCIAGHSLGAGFALQVGKALAKEGMYVETHLFNPPSVSLAMSFRNIGEKAGFAWKRFKSMLPLSNETQVNNEESDKTIGFGLKNWISGLKGPPGVGLGKWVPHLYVNNSDYICCSYTDRDGIEGNNAGKENVGPSSITTGQVAAKLFVMSKGNQKFLEAHGLEQWWSDDLELQLALHNSKLITRQLKSLYSLPAPQPALPR